MSCYHSVEHKPNLKIWRPRKCARTIGFAKIALLFLYDVGCSCVSCVASGYNLVIIEEQQNCNRDGSPIYFRKRPRHWYRAETRKGIMGTGLSAGMFGHIGQTALWGLVFTTWS